MTTLKSLKDGALTPEQVSAKTGQPLFLVRSGLRELKNAGFIEETDEKFNLSTSGQGVIQ
jgi:predicted transcriptional regulator